MICVCWESSFKKLIYNQVVSSMDEIKLTFVQNKRTFQIEGQKIYYSHSLLLMFLVWNILMFVFSVFGIIWFYVDYIPVFGLILVLTVRNLIENIIPKFLYKNPIFIINKEELFYTKTEISYNLQNCEVKFLRKLHFNFRFFTILEDGVEVISESFLFIKNSGEFKRQIGNIKKNHDYRTY